MAIIVGPGETRDKVDPHVISSEDLKHEATSLLLLAPIFIGFLLLVCWLIALLP